MLTFFITEDRDSNSKQTVVSKKLTIALYPRHPLNFSVDLLITFLRIRFLSQLTVEGIIEHCWHINNMES